MTEHNEDTVERVARAILKARFYDCEPEMYGSLDSFMHEIWTIDANDHRFDAENEARAALSAMPPQEVTVQDCIAAVEDCYFIPDNDIDEAKHDGITLAVEALRALSEGE